MNRPFVSEPTALPPPTLPKRPFLHSFTFWAVCAVALTLLIGFSFHNGPWSVLLSILTIFEVIVLFNILIIVHELGHFLAARWQGLKVEKFAIWFGRPLWSRTINGVEYILGSIPAGGYVALPQMANPDAIEGKTEEPREPLPAASPLSKIIVAFAGPLFSFGLALVFATIVWAVGRPVSDTEKTVTIGYAMPGGPAAKAGLQGGDVIKAIDGHPVHRWSGVPDGITWRIISSTGPITLDIERARQSLSLTVTPLVDLSEHHWWQRGVPPRIQIAPAEKDIVVGKVIENGPAAYAGLREGDHLVALNGAPLYSSLQLYDALKNHPNDPMSLTLSRGGATWTQSLQPVRPISPVDLPKDEPQTNIGLELNGLVNVVLDHPLPWNQVLDSVNMVRSTLAALFAPHSKVSASLLSGPVGIMNLFYMVLSSDNGWRIALWLAVVINVNLAMLNLLPLPVLDGGHILLSVIEWLRRRPLSMSILEPLQTACAVLLISYMLYVSFFDAQDSYKIASSGGELKFAPPAAAP